MKVTNLKLICLSLLLLHLLAGCRNEGLSDISVIDQTRKESPNTELHQWINREITQPYGIEVNYRWDKNKVSNGIYTIPPREDNIKAVLTAVKALCLEFYTDDEIGGKNYLKGKSPICIHLFGGPNLDANGVEIPRNLTDSSAEISIYRVNDFDPADKEKVYILMRSVHHQFARRLVSLFPYDRDAFNAISKHRYNSSTAEVLQRILGKTKDIKGIYTPNRYSNIRGMMTFHGFLSEEIDICEMISVFLTDTPETIRTIQENAKTPDKDSGSDPQVQVRYDEEAKQASKEVNAKIAFVKEYFSKKLRMDLEEMQIISQSYIKKFIESQQSQGKQVNDEEN